MITGSFTKVEVPPVAAGQQLVATLGYYALNPGAWYWKTFLIAVSPGRLRQEISATRELGEEGHQEHTYWLGDIEHGRLIQPDREIAITFMLFGHDDAGYQWDWQDLNAALVGIPNPSGAQLLATYPVFTGPGAGPAPIPGDLKVLDYQILGQRQGGSITFDPPALDYEGHYAKGTVVTLTAVVNPGFRFIKWRGEVDNELSTSLTNKVTMSENRLVKAEFGLVEVEEVYPLAIDITPAGAGYVTTEPPPADINNYFIHDTIGKFAAGVRVLLTAHPNPGYEFYKWSDEIQGGVSYSNPEYVKDMDEHRGVKAHFRESGAPIPPEPPPPPPTPPPENGLPDVLKSKWLVPGLIVGAALLLLSPGKKGK